MSARALPSQPWKVRSSSGWSHSVTISQNKGAPSREKATASSSTSSLIALVEENAGQRTLQQFRALPVGTFVVHIVQDEQPSHPIRQQAEIGRISDRVAIGSERPGPGSRQPLLRAAGLDQLIFLRPPDRMTICLITERTDWCGDAVQPTRDDCSHRAPGAIADGRNVLCAITSCPA